jgi:hypothetical protein
MTSSNCALLSSLAALDPGDVLQQQPIARIVLADDQPHLGGGDVDEFQLVLGH